MASSGRMRNCVPVRILPRFASGRTCFLRQTASPEVPGTKPAGVSHPYAKLVPWGLLMATISMIFTATLNSLRDPDWFSGGFSQAGRQKNACSSTCISALPVTSRSARISWIISRTTFPWSGAVIQYLPGGETARSWDYVENCVEDYTATLTGIRCCGTATTPHSAAIAGYPPVELKAEGSLSHPLQGLSGKASDRLHPARLIGERQ